VIYDNAETTMSHTVATRRLSTDGIDSIQIAKTVSSCSNIDSVIQLLKVTVPHAYNIILSSSPLQPPTVVACTAALLLLRRLTLFQNPL